jgi:integrase/recombinase XerD
MPDKPSRVRVGGPLAVYRASFVESLAGAGYTTLSAANLVRLMAHLSRWLDERGKSAADLTPEVIAAYLVARREAGYVGFLSTRGLAPLLDHLRGLGAAPVPKVLAVSGRLEEVIDRYRLYLVEERGLVASTVRYYLVEARRFLADCGRGDDRGLGLGELTAGEVTAFVVQECARRSVGTAKILVTVLRSLLRFLFLEGLTRHELVSAVPTVAGWRGSHLPRALSEDNVSVLLASRQGRTPADHRDGAILVLLLRLGLRAVEVARLRLDDIDWRRGEVTIRGKGRRDERLPLPDDVGRAIVGYLRRARPNTAARTVFISVRAPLSPMTAGGVMQVVRTTAARVGLDGVTAHRLRHTAATRMLAAQAPLTEVGQVLRHRSPATTAIYAKVDRARLRELALPWPQVSA